MSAAAVWSLVGHTARDVLPMVPVLLVLYTALELVSHREGTRLRSRTFGPVAGALLGVIPQCGVSVFATSLYLTGRVTTGTLVATYLATSDEAIPVLLAHGRDYQAVAGLVAVKLVVGAVAGLVVDRLLPGGIGPASAPPSRSWIQLHVENEMSAAPWNRALAHGARRTVEIAAWVFVITLALGLALESSDLQGLAAQARVHPAVEVIATALFGLVPNCAASIAIAEGYLRGVLSAGAAVAGLCAGAGYGPILLFRRAVLGTAVRLLALCLAWSLAAGALVSLLAGRLG
jgi:hypothetical protein